MPSKIHPSQVKTIIEVIAEKQKIKHLTPFIFYARNQKTNDFVPLSLDKSIPEQTVNILDLHFRRQLQIFTGEQMTTVRTASIAYRDARYVVHKLTPFICQQNAVALAAYGFLAEADGTVYSANEIPDDVSKYLPRGYPAASSLGPKFAISLAKITFRSKSTLIGSTFTQQSFAQLSEQLPSGSRNSIKMP